MPHCYGLCTKKNNSKIGNDEKDYLRIIVEEASRLSVLCENTMALAKLDSESSAKEERIFSLDGQIEDCILLFDNQLKEIKNGDFKELIEALMQKPIDEMKELYNNRDIDFVDYLLKMIEYYL